MPTGNRCLELLSYIKLIISRLQGTSWRPGNFPVINRSWDWFFFKWESDATASAASQQRSSETEHTSVEEKTKPKLFGRLPEESEGGVLLINGSNCRHSSTGGSAHCPVRLANNFGRRGRQELRQWSRNTDRGWPYGYHRLSDSFEIKKLKKCGWSKSREASPLDEGYRQWMNGCC